MRLYSYRASANCLKVRCLGSLLGTELEIVEVDIFDGGTLTEEFAALNPLREVPVLELDDGSALAQSSAILQYLAEDTAWAGEDRLARARITAWMLFEQEQVMPGIGGVRFRLATGRADVDELAPRVEVGRAALDRLEGHLRAHEWLVGERPSIADVSVWAYAHLAADAGLPPAGWPAFASWCERLEAITGWLDDLEPYPANARPGEGRSTYD